MDLPTKIRVIRAVKNWKQADLAKALGVNWTTVSSWENGKSGPHYAVSQKVEKLYEEARAELIKG